MSGRIDPALDEAVYHSGPELSVSGAKLLRKSPALYRFRRDNTERKDAFDFGSVVHGLILGTGWPLTVVDADNWMSKAAKEAKATAYKEGRVPILRHDLRRAAKIRNAVRAHPVAGAILSAGVPEQSIYWTDEPSGVACRARVDWTHAKALVDVKTCADASPEGFAKSCASFGYDMQAAAYTAGYQAATGDQLPFLFIAVEKEPPHLVAVYDLDFPALDRGARLWREALDTYAACTAADNWPAYGDDIQTLSLPRWAK